VVDDANHVRLTAADLQALVFDLDRMRLQLKSHYAILDANTTIVRPTALDHIAVAIESLDTVVTSGFLKRKGHEF
jgi:hypothetical protein